MRKTLVALLVTLFIACLSMQSYAAKGGEKGPSDRAYERASDNASFKREIGKAEHRRNRHDDSDDWRSRLEDDSDSDSDVKSMYKKDRKEKKNKK